MSRYNKLHRDWRQLDRLGMSHDIINCIVTGEGLANWGCLAIQRAAALRYGKGACDTTHRGTCVREAIQPPGACDTAPYACDTARPGLRNSAGCAQAGPRLGALCTRPSFGLNALFQSLFGPLFMNTVHKNFSFFLNKLKSNQMK